LQQDLKRKQGSRLLGPTLHALLRKKRLTNSSVSTASLRLPSGNAQLLSAMHWHKKPGPKSYWHLPSIRPTSRLRRAKQKRKPVPSQKPVDRKRKTSTTAPTVCLC